MENIYRAELLDLIKNPTYRGTLDNPVFSIVEKNPMCGDLIRVELGYLESSQDEKITMRYDGEACAVCLASCELISEELDAAPIHEITKLSKERVLDMLGVKLTTSRVKCALLPLTAVQNLFEQYEQKK